MAELNLIIGCMFSGKTTELLRIAKRLRSIDQNVLIINYIEDKRYSDTEMSTHDLNKIPCLFSDDLKDDTSIFDAECNYTKTSRNVRIIYIKGSELWIKGKEIGEKGNWKESGLLGYYGFFVKHKSLILKHKRHKSSQKSFHKRFINSSFAKALL